MHDRERGGPSSLGCALCAGEDAECTSEDTCAPIVSDLAKALEKALAGVKSPIADKRLLRAIRAVANRQSKLSAPYYLKHFVPPAARFWSNFGSLEALHLDDMEGAAMECLAVIVIAISVATLQLGLGKPVPSFELVQPVGCCAASPELRASAVKPLSRTTYSGWAPYFKGKLKAEGVASAAVDAAKTTGGSMAFSDMLPIKSLSAGNLLDYGFNGLKLMAVLYAARRFLHGPRRMAKNRPLNRAQVECVAEASARAAPASSDRRRTPRSARPPPRSRTASRRIRRARRLRRRVSRRRRATPKRWQRRATRASARRGRRRRGRGGGDRGELCALYARRRRDGPHALMMERQKRGPSARTWLAIAAVNAIVAVGVRFVL